MSLFCRRHYSRVQALVLHLWPPSSSTSQVPHPSWSPSLDLRPRACPPSECYTTWRYTRMWTNAAHHFPIYNTSSQTSKVDYWLWNPSSLFVLGVEFKAHAHIGWWDGQNQQQVLLWELPKSRRPQVTDLLKKSAVAAWCFVPLWDVLQTCQAASHTGNIFFIFSPDSSIFLCFPRSLVVNVMQRDSIPSEVDYETRQGVYSICLQLARCKMPLSNTDTQG